MILIVSPGNAPPIEADEKFASTHEALVELLTQQVGVYEREEHALRVLMEEEVLEKMQSHQERGWTSNFAVRNKMISTVASIHWKFMACFFCW